MEFVESNGARIAYTLAGPEDGVPLIMSHSLSANHRMWDPQLPALTDKYRVVLVDTRGHGQSDAPVGPYTLDQLADDMLAVMDALGIGQAHFCGLSMGGMIAQTLALKAPDRLLSLVLCDTSSAYPPEAKTMWDERITAARSAGLAATADATLDRWFSPGFAAQEPAVMDSVRDMICSTPVEGYCGCGAAISVLALSGRLGEIELPTLVIVGEDDQGTPVGMAEVIADGIAGARLLILPVARHLANMEAVEQFNAELRSFLDGVGS